MRAKSAIATSGKYVLSTPGLGACLRGLESLCSVPVPADIPTAALSLWPVAPGGRAGTSRGFSHTHGGPGCGLSPFRRCPLGGLASQSSATAVPGNLLRHWCRVGGSSCEDFHSSKNRPLTPGGGFGESGESRGRKEIGVVALCLGFSAGQDHKWCFFFYVCFVILILT